MNESELNALKLELIQLINQCEDEVLLIKVRDLLLESKQEGKQSKK